MDYTLPKTLLCIKPCDMIWGGEHTIWLNHVLMGFKLCMGNGVHDIVTNVNYGRVGLLFDNGYQLVPLMHLGFHGSAKLRAWLMINLSFCLVVLGVVLALRKGNRGDL